MLSRQRSLIVDATFICGLISARICLIAGVLLAIACLPARAQPIQSEAVDTALILAVDTSGSVSEERFRLQMDGIAAALEDTGVINTILGGPRGAISLMLVAWADNSQIALPWTLVRSKGEAIAAAAKIRALPRHSGEYTCMGRMLRNLKEAVLGDVPFAPLKTVIDISGDGIDNCEEPESLSRARAQVVEAGAVINGLPIIVDRSRLVGEGAYRAPGAGLKPLTPPDQRPRRTLRKWYEDKVIGGFGAFTIPANGYKDFARAMRSKFVVEISWADELKGARQNMKMPAEIAQR
ncbi:MAG: DUF1194 domain-containing protein [Alphaproteobacteria bacterium]|nr:DUF1194 domain-containing protein [Alphaproteobacteria bacterium]